VDLGNGDAFLLHAVALPQGDAVVLQGLVVDGQANGGAQGVLTAVALANGVFFVVLGEETESKAVLDLAGQFGEPVLFDQRQQGHLDRGHKGR